MVTKLLSSTLLPITLLPITQLPYYHITLLPYYPTGSTLQFNGLVFIFYLIKNAEFKKPNKGGAMFVHKLSKAREQMNLKFNYQMAYF